MKTEKRISFAGQKVYSIIICRTLILIVYFSHCHFLLRFCPLEYVKLYELRKWVSFVWVQVWMETGFLECRVLSVMWRFFIIVEKILKIFSQLMVFLKYAPLVWFLCRKWYDVDVRFYPETSIDGFEFTKSIILKFKSPPLSVH